MPHHLSEVVASGEALRARVDELPRGVADERPRRFRKQARIWAKLNTETCVGEGRARVIILHTRSHLELK